MDPPSTGTDIIKATAAYSKSLVAASLYVDYIFLDADERRRIAQNPHEYLITQLQFTGDESIGSSSNKIKLNFNHPVKELIWVVQPDRNVDYCGSLAKATGTADKVLDSYEAKGAQPFNYTDQLDGLLNDMTVFGAQNVANGFITDEGEMVARSMSDPNTAVATANLAEVGSATSYVLGETSLDMHCWGLNPVVTAKLQLNGQDRFSEREGSYFAWVQPYQSHTRCPDEGINVYSFAIRPEEHQPSGTCNFSRIDNATLQLVVSNAAIGGDKTAKVRVYATNYNVLRIVSGMGGLAYSN
jgi:hypothetical protein